MLASHSIQEERNEYPIEKDGRTPEMDFSQSFIHHPAREFWVPEINCGEPAEYYHRDQGVMEMGYNEIRIVGINIEGAGTEVNTSNAANQEFSDKTQREQHGWFKAEVPAPEGGDIGEDGYGERNGDENGGDAEYRGHTGIDAGDKLMMSPYDEGKQARHHSGINDGAVPKQWLAGKSSQYFSRKTQGGKKENINFGMSEKPK